MCTQLKVYGVHINKLIKETEYKLFAKLISVEKQEKIKRFSNPCDSQRSIISELLIRYILHSKYKLSLDEIILTTNNFGKPFLQHKNPIYFNVSHSGAWVVGVFDLNPVGIDIEEVKQLDISFARYFLSIEEVDYLFSLKEEKQLDAFYNIWTLKESYVKAIGEGLSIPLNSFSVVPYFKDTVYKKRRDNWHLQSAYIADNYKMSLCTFDQKLPVNTICYTVENFFDMVESTLFNHSVN